MFIGHFAVGMGAKKAAPRISLGTLFIAAQFLDLLWPTLLLLGIEHVAINPLGTSSVPLNFTYYPWSHSLVMAIVWGAVVGGIYFLLRKNTKASIVLFFLVISHWVLDLFVHHPDLTLVPGGNTFVGWSLWDDRGLELMIELVMFAIGLILYLRTTKATSAVGKYGIWGLAIFLLAIHVSNYFGPPPPNVSVIAWLAELQWLFVALAFWVDRHRSVRIRNELTPSTPRLAASGA